jgi:hypothetical protein
VRNRDFKRLCETYLLPHISEDFRVNRGVLYEAPVDLLLRGFVFATSSFSKEGFYVSVLVQPLYIPVEGLTGLGDRLDPGGYDIDGGPGSDEEQRVMADILASMQRDGLPFLERLKTPREVAEHSDRDDLNDLERAVYSWVAAGEQERARVVMERFRVRVDEAKARDRERGREREWVNDRAADAERLMLELETGGLDAAQAQLRRWRDQTLEALKLE